VAAHLSGSFSPPAPAPAPSAPVPGVRPCCDGQPPGGACRGIHWLWGTAQSRDLQFEEGREMDVDQRSGGAAAAASCRPRLLPACVLLTSAPSAHTCSILQP
jgi:hypothetical protein